MLGSLWTGLFTRMVRKFMYGCKEYDDKSAKWLKDLFKFASTDQ